MLHQPHLVKSQLMYLHQEIFLILHRGVHLRSLPQKLQILPFLLHRLEGINQEEHFPSSLALLMWE